MFSLTLPGYHTQLLDNLEATLPIKGRVAGGPPHPTPPSTALWARVHVLHLNKTSTCQIITTSKETLPTWHFRT